MNRQYKYLQFTCCSLNKSLVHNTIRLLVNVEVKACSVNGQIPFSVDDSLAVKRTAALWNSFQVRHRGTRSSVILKHAMWLYELFTTLMHDYNPTCVKPAFWWMWLMSDWNSIGIIQSFFGSPSFLDLTLLSSLLSSSSECGGMRAFRWIFIVPWPSMKSSLNRPSSEPKSSGVSNRMVEFYKEIGKTRYLQMAPLVNRIVPLPSLLPATHIPS